MLYGIHIYQCCHWVGKGCILLDVVSPRRMTNDISSSLWLKQGPVPSCGASLALKWRKTLTCVLGINNWHNLIVRRGCSFCCPRHTEFYMHFQRYYFTWDSLPRVTIESIGVCLPWTFHHKASLYDSLLSWRWIFLCTLSGLEGIHASSFITSKSIDIDSKAWWTWRWSWTYSWLK